jgi:hypothetical protein
MQTFLPYPGFAESAAALDRQRLGKQRVETLQIAKALTGQSAGWVHHPATLMWTGRPEALLAYQIAVCHEWTGRGYADTCLRKTADVLGLPLVGQHDLVIDLWPDWIGWADFHRAHKSNLVRKMPEWYAPLWPEVPNNLPYLWPTAKEQSND